MRRIVLMVVACAAMAACVGTRPRVAPAHSPWAQRVSELQGALSWQMSGRAAVAVGTQGWQASLDWREQDALAEVHLAGPLGVGAVVLKQTPEGLSMNGAPPSEAVVSQLQERLGFELPLGDLRYWLLGVPAPDETFDLTRNGDDRAQQLLQAGWTLTYDRYVAVAGDLLPARLVLTRGDVRVRIAVDHWEGVR